jgi:hypothetical protein
MVLHLWCNDAEFWEITAVTNRITCEQLQVVHQGMCTNVKVGHGRGFCTHGLAVDFEGLAGQKGRVPRQCFAHQGQGRQGGFKVVGGAG